MTDVKLFDLSGRCQSCGISMMDGFFGTNADGSAATDYCKFCFNSGHFTQAQLTREEMIRLSIENMTDENRMSLTVAEDLANKIIPRLARWRGEGANVK